MYRNGVADSLGAVTNELGRLGRAVAVDGLGVSGLRGIGGILLLREPKNVGPLLQGLGVCKIRVSVSSNIGP